MQFPRRPTVHRPSLLDRREPALAALADCRLCAFDCGVDRTAGPAGRCHADAVPRLFHEGIEWAGEEGLVPTYVASLSGCNMTCSFCLTGSSSQDGRAGWPLDPDAFAARLEAAAPRLRSVTILGGEPTIHLAGALELAARVPRHLDLVWKTNAYASPAGLRLLEGVPDVVLADYKFGRDDCARRLAGVPNYSEVVRANLRWAARHSRLIVRHLLMPGHVDCCLAPVARWMADELPEAPLVLMTGYLPRHLAAGDPGLGRSTRADERERARGLVRGLRTVPWVLAPGPSPLEAPPDEISIDPSGRLCIDSGSAELVSALRRLGPEFAIAP